MYQAPPPTRQPQHRHADRYALGIGALAGLIYSFVHAFEIWPGNYVANWAIKVASTVFVFLPYLNVDDLVFEDWLARVRAMRWIYAGLAALALLPALLVPQSIWWPGTIMLLVFTAIVGALASLALERRWIRPKI